MVRPAPQAQGSCPRPQHTASQLPPRGSSVFSRRAHTTFSSARHLQCDFPAPLALRCDHGTHCPLSSLHADLFSVRP